MNACQPSGSTIMIAKPTKFKFRDDNRDIDVAHVQRLKASLNLHNDLHLSPVIVNTKMEVIDGQHRVKAAQELGLDVHYVVDDNYEHSKMITFNTTQRQWKPEDFLKYWISHGRIDYRKLKDFKDDLGFPLSAMLKWMSFGGGQPYKDFKSGSFKFNLNERLLQSLLSMQKLISIMKSRNYKPINVYKQGSFHEAAREFFTNGLVDHERFFARFEVVPFQIRYSQLWQEYLEQLVEIYNFDMRKDRVRLLQDGQKREITT